MPEADLTALADLADVSAQGLLTRCPPEEWGESRLVAGLQFVAGRLRRADCSLPKSLLDVVERAKA